MIIIHDFRPVNEMSTVEQETEKLCPEQEEPIPETVKKSKNKINLCLSFFGSRIFIFLFLMLKWAIMVFAAALTLALISSMIFLSISIIYNLIKMSCQCELNEGEEYRQT